MGVSARITRVLLCLALVNLACGEHADHMGHGDHTGHEKHMGHDDHTGHDDHDDDHSDHGAHGHSPSDHGHHGHGATDEDCDDDESAHDSHSDHGHEDHTDHGTEDHTGHGHAGHGHEGHTGHGHEDHTGHGHEDHTDHDTKGHTDHGHAGHTGHGHKDHAEHGTEDRTDHGHAGHTGHGHKDHTDHGTDDHTDHGMEDHSDHGHAGHGHHGHADMSEPGKCLDTKHVFDGKDNYLDVMNDSPELSDFTFCTFAMTDSRGVISGVLLSFSHDQPRQNVVILGAKERRNSVIRIVFQGQTRKINTRPLGFNNEMHLCAVTSSAKNEITIFLNGKRTRVMKFRSIGPIPEGGKISVGKMSGDKYPMYTGTIRNLMIWGTQLTEAQILELYEANECPGKEILTLTKMNVIPMKANIKSEACVDEEYTLDNMGDKVEYLELAETIPDLDFVTICVRVTTDAKGTIPGTIASYSTKANPKMIVAGGAMGDDGPLLRLEVNGEVQTFEGQFVPNTKYDFCMVYHLVHGHLMTYVNGQLSLMLMFKHAKPLPGNGVILIGQRQSKMGGCLDSDLAYTGKIQGFSVWGRALSIAEIEVFSEGMCASDAVIKSALEDVIPYGLVFSSSVCPSVTHTLDNTGNKLEYVQSLKTFMKPYDYLTVCARVVTDANGMLPGAVGSYATKNIVDSLYFGGEMKNGKPHMRVTLNGVTVVKEAIFKPSTEYFNCVSYHIPHGHVLTYINGFIASDLHFPNAKSIPAGGVIIAGQKQESFGGSFDRSRAYNGKLTDFMVWNRVLSEAEMMAMATLNKCPDGAIIDLAPGNAMKVTGTV